MRCKIRVKEEIAGLYQHCQPKVGKVYNAEYVAPYDGQPQKFKAICIVNISGKRIILREDEFELVG